MTSCDEARFYLGRRGLTRLDPDGNGVPCEAVSVGRSSGLGSPICTPSSARRSKHSRDNRPWTNLDRAHDFETMALVERDVARVRRLEVGQCPLVITPRNHMPHQRSPDAPPLGVRLDTDEGEIPVGRIGMRLFHPFGGDQQIVDVLGRRVIAKHLLTALAIRMHSGRKPERYPAEVVGHVQRLDVLRT